jgi:hypothetical protein
VLLTDSSNLPRHGWHLRKDSPATIDEDQFAPI